MKKEIGEHLVGQWVVAILCFFSATTLCLISLGVIKVSSGIWWLIVIITIVCSVSLLYIYAFRGDTNEAQ